MGLIKCPSCACTISEDVVTCPACGMDIRRRAFYGGKNVKNAIPVRCPWCGETVPAGERNCPGCGSPAKATYRPTE